MIPIRKALMFKRISLRVDMKQENPAAFWLRDF